MKISLRAFIMVLTMIIAILQSVYVAYHSFRILVIGQAVLEVTEVPYMEAAQTPVQYPSVIYVPDMDAMIPLSAAITIIIGLLVRRLYIAWAGLVTLCGFSLLFVFGVGGEFLKISGFLLLTVGLISLEKRILSPKVVRSR